MSNDGYGTLSNNDGAGSRDVKTVTFTQGDPENPRNFPTWRKWTIVASITLIDLTVSWGASGFSPAKDDFEDYFQIDSDVVATLGLSLYVLGLAIGPMSLAPLSEYYGRTRLYVLPYGSFVILLGLTAITQDLGAFFVLRFFSGAFASVTISNFGGSIADLWPRHQVGPAMSIFLWAAVCGSPSGYFLMSFVAADHDWRAVFWALAAVCGAFWIILFIVLVLFKNETRHSVLLRRRAARLREEHDDERITVPAEMQQKSVVQLFQITLYRPFRFLFTEAIIVFAALYNGYLYGISFLFNGAFDIVFGDGGHGFGTLGVGLCFSGFVLGVSAGPVINIWQERYYQRSIRSTVDDENATLLYSHGGNANASEADHFRNLPEARTQLGKAAGLLLPVSLLWFALSSEPSFNVHWIVPILATALFGFSFYTLILMSYTYCEDSYMIYAASALAGVGLARNLAGATFPLFGSQMYKALGYGWAGTVLAGMALLLAPIPFILEKYGSKLRARSPYARLHMDDVDDGQGEH